MVDFASQDKPTQELYRLMIGCIVPRPIGFVATRSASGIANLAPYSFFNGVTPNPPTVAFTVLDRGDEMKDTSRNVGEHGEFIVHIVSHALAEPMNVTCGEYGADVDEFEESGLTAVPGTVVDVPRVAEALVALECRVTHHLRLGRGGSGSSHILGEVVYWHIADHLVDLARRDPIDPAALDAIGRMGSIEYATTRDRFTMERPVVKPEDPRSVASAKARAREAK